MVYLVEILHFSWIDNVSEMTSCEYFDIQSLMSDAYQTQHILFCFFDTMFFDIQHWKLL